MSSENKPKTPVTAVERDKIDRNVLVWLNKFPGNPVGTVTTESHLKADETGMAMSSTTNAYIERSYILGGYRAEYQFVVIYRIKPGGSMDRSLKADELLNRLGDWARRNKPSLGEGIQVIKVEPVSIAELYAAYEDGDEDHHIPIKIVYEVI